MTITTKARHLGLEEFEAKLRQQHADKLDAIVPSTGIVSVDGNFHITGMGTTLPEGARLDALFTAPVGYGEYVPSDVAIGHFADKLRVPVEFLRRMRRERTDIFDTLINSLLHGSEPVEGSHFAAPAKSYPADPRRFFVRTFVDPDGGPGVLRALLSDSFRSFENYDVLITVLEAMREVDPDLHVLPNARITEQRINFTVSSPRIVAAAPVLLAGYRSPFGDDQPGRWDAHSFTPGDVGPGGRRVGDLVSAGIGVSNSEVGHGKLQLDAKFTVLACTNGLTMTHDIGKFARVHLGARNTVDGIVRWSEETHRANLDLVRAMTGDAVRAFVNPEYLAENIARIEEKAGREVEDPQATIEIVRKELGFSQDTAATVLRHFIRGGQTTVAGVVQAVTSAAQVTDDGDEGFLMEQQAMKVLEAAYRAA